MKKAILKGVVSIVVFVISLFGISMAMNSGNTDMTVEMASATYPLVYMNVEGTDVNYLYGYATAMEGKYLRETITPISASRSLSMTIRKYNATVKKIEYEVRSISGDRLVENGELTNYTEDNENIRASFSIKDLIEENEEYTLVFKLSLDNGNTVYYYTRIIQEIDYHVKEKLEFVQHFHECTFDKEAAKDIMRYIEPNSEGDNTTYSKVTIHSSFNQITWGDLPVTKMEEPVIGIKELGRQTASMVIHYRVMTKENKKTAYYQVSEFYRIRYGTERMYLLDFERTMEQVFSPKGDFITNNKIVLGIADPSIEMRESDGGNVLAFVYAGRLYSYNAAEHKFAVLFSFYDENNTDIRTLHDDIKIKILSVDEAGNVYFSVYGYMNRGRHEGSVGIQVMFFNSSLNTVEEEIYIPYQKSPVILAADMDVLSYLSKDNLFYLMLDGTIYSVDLTNKSFNIVVSHLEESSYRISDSNEMIAWKSGTDNGMSSQLKLMNLNTMHQITIEAGAGNCIVPLGFMNEDLIYGIAAKEDVIKDGTGKITIPMNIVKIQNEFEEVLEVYHKQDIYVLDCTIDENQITLKRVKRDADSTGFEPATNDQIMNTQEEESGKNKIEVVATQDYEKIVQLSLKATSSNKPLKILTPKEVVFEGGRTLELLDNTDGISRYYVYGKNGIAGIYTNPASAINLANDIYGVVINDEGAYVWSRGNRSVKNQIMAIAAAEATTEKNSLAICLDTILKYEGLMRNSEYLLDRGESVLSILEGNIENVEALDLSGCSLDSVLYYVNLDIPVLAILDDGNAVLIVGFNELNTVLMNPLTGTIYKMGMNDSKEWFQENGNYFVTYIHTET